MMRRNNPMVELSAPSEYCAPVIVTHDMIPPLLTSRSVSMELTFSGISDGLHQQSIVMHPAINVR